MENKVYGCPEKYSDSAKLHRRVVGEKIEGYFGDSFRVDDGLYLRPDFLEKHGKLIEERRVEMPLEIRKKLEELGITDAELRERITGSVVSIIGHKGKFTGSGGFITPNVISTVAHVLRDSQNGEMSMLGLIIGGDGQLYQPKAIYIETICGDDIAFILTQESSNVNMNVWGNAPSNSGDTVTLGMPWTQSDFLRESDVSLGQKILPNISRFLNGILFPDSDSDGRKDLREYATTNVHTFGGHSGGLVIDPANGGIRGIIARGSKYKGIRVGGMYEPISKLRPRFIDFVEAMSEFGFEVER